MTTIADLSQTMNGWTRWMRVRRALSWGVRGLIFGLALALAVGLAGLFQARLLRVEFLQLVGVSAVFFSLCMGAAAYLWPVHPLKAARYFDRVFGLGERVSTALELDSESPGSHPNELVRQQLDDAVQAARTVKPAQTLPLRLPAREGLLVLIFVLLLGLAWLRGENLFQAAQQARAVQQAAAVQEQKIEEILTQIKNNDTLSDEQKQALSAPLEQALNGLRENPSLEGSVSALTSAGEKLEALSAPQAQELAQALKEAGSQAAGQEGSPLESVGQELAEGNPVAAASALKDIDAGALSQARAQELAGQLETMAQALAATNPQLAIDLNNAAQALQNGDAAAAQQALDQAAQSLAQAGQQAALSQAADQAAQQMQQGVGQMLAAGGGQQQAAQPGQGQGQANGEGTTGSGTGTSQGPVAGSEQGGSSPIPQDNGPGDGGETSYEQIYAPSDLGGDDGPSVSLPSSGQDGDTIGQGPTNPSDPGQSLVPYQEVYSQYEQLNNQAIENGSIPFQFMLVIRNYFDSLEE
jgi:hypothetical protein